MSDETLRLARSEDFPGILDLLNRCFDFENGGFEAEWSHCVDRSKPERHAIVTTDGRIVSHVACIPNTLHVGGAKLRCWGISGVATDPRYRGEGYMTRLLEYWIDRMAEEDVPLSNLVGDRQRYGRFGWEVAGREREYELTSRSFGAHTDPDREAFVRRYEATPDDLDLVGELYRTLAYRVARTRDQLRTRLGRRQFETLLYTEPDREAYLSFTKGGSRNMIAETAGSPDGVRVLLTRLFRRYGLSEAVCRLHPTHPLNSLFASPDVSVDWELGTHRILRINDAPTVVAAYEDQFRRRWRRLGPADSGSLTLGLDDQAPAVTLAWTGDSVTVSRERTEPDIRLNRQAMTRFLFGFPETVDAAPSGPFLETVLPLEFYIPWTDEV